MRMVPARAFILAAFYCLGFNVLGAAEAASTQAKSHQIPELLQQVEEKYRKVSTIKADFTQKIEVASTKTQKTSSGKIWIMRPNKVRWHTLKPEESLLVGNGKKYWFYTPPFDEEDEEDHGQVIIKDASKVQSRLADALLAGSFSLAKDVRFSKKTESSFLLHPIKKGAAGDVEKAEIEINKDKKLIEKVTLYHHGGNVSRIELSDIELGPSLEDSLFEYEIPKGAEVIKQD